MILSDESLLHLIKDYDLIDNYQPEQIQPASIDLRLNETLTFQEIINYCSVNEENVMLKDWNPCEKYECLLEIKGVWFN